MFVFSPYKGRFFHCDRAAELLGRHEVLLAALEGKHVADHLSGNANVAWFRFPLSSSLAWVRASLEDSLGASLAASNQYSLDMSVPLLGNRHPHHLLGRALFVAA